MAEGEMVVRRLLKSGLTVQSILSIDRKAEAMAQAVQASSAAAQVSPTQISSGQSSSAQLSTPTPGMFEPAGANIPVYSAPPEVVNQVVGFRFHSGVMACGVRPAATNVDELMARAPANPTFVVCPKIASTDNLGSLVRIAAGFGCDGIILGPESCDPFYRQAVRVSMGAVFHLPVLQSTDLAADLIRLRDVHKVSLLATILSPAAISLPDFRRSGGVALMLGNEFEGLSEAEVSLSTHQLTIPMKRGTDSLNVAASAAVFLYVLTIEK